MLYTHVGVVRHNCSVAGKFKRVCVYNVHVHRICLFSLEEYGSNVHVLTLREGGKKCERERVCTYMYHEYLFYMLLMHE